MYRNPYEMTFWPLQKNPDILKKILTNQIVIIFVCRHLLNPDFVRHKHLAINFNHLVVNFKSGLTDIFDPTVKSSSHLVLWNVIRTSPNLWLGGSADPVFLSGIYIENFRYCIHFQLHRNNDTEILSFEPKSR